MPPAWTSPSTQTTLHKVSTAEWNGVVNDLKVIGDARQTYTPAVTATITNPTLGTNYVVEGAYVLMGKLCICEIAIQFGNPGVVAGSGDYIVSLPADPKTSTTTISYLGLGFCTRAGQLLTTLHAVRSGSSAMKAYVAAANPIFWGAASPWAPVATSEVHFTLTYEVA